MKTVRQVLERAAQEGAKAISATRREGISIREKSYKDLVTDCDLASEKAIISVLREAFPESAFYSEEAGYEEGSPRRLSLKGENWLWVIDPIDGTHNFVYGLANYGISIAGVRDNKFIVGLIYLPETNDCFFAYQNQGAELNGKKLSVSGRDKLAQSMIAYDNQFHNHPLMLKNFKPVIDSCFTIRILGSAVVDLCKVAEGVLDARIFHQPKLVDFAAGAFIVEEAGGTVTDLNGEKVTLNSTSVVASNGRIHQSLLSVLSKT